MVTRLSNGSLSVTKRAITAVLLPKGMDEAATTSQMGLKGLPLALNTVKLLMHLAH